jgi:hypothetical protein
MALHLQERRMSYSDSLTDEERFILKEFIADHATMPRGRLIERLGRILLAIRRESLTSKRRWTPDLIAALQRTNFKRKKFDAKPSDN